MALAPDDYNPSTKQRLSLFRRLLQPSTPTPSSLTAAGMNVDLSNESAISTIARSRQQWQTQVWEAYDVNGEIHNATNAVADLMSRITLFAAEESSVPDARPIRTEDAKAISTLSRLGSTTDISKLLHDMSMQKLLPGEFNLVGLAPDPSRPNKDREEWLVVSIEELKTQGATAVITHPTGAQITLRAGSDTWIRVWTPHPRKHILADSPLRPLLNNIDELVWWDAAAASVAMNRAALAGFIGIPTNLEVAAESGDDPRLSGNQRFVKRLFSNIIRAIREPRSPSAAAPFVYTYPWNESGKSGLDVTTLDRPQDQLLEERTDRSLRRIAQGFPLPVETFFGMGESSFRNAGQITKSKFTEIVEPFVIDLVGDLTLHWFRPILTKLGIDASKYLIWYDASALITPPNIEEQANKGFEYGNIDGKAWRRVSNFSEADAPSPEEADKQLAWIRALRGREGNTNNQQNPNAPDETNANLPEPTGTRNHAPRPTSTGGKGKPVFASAADTPSRDDLGRRLAEIDTDLLSRLQVMASEQTRQALIKAGNFLRNNARKNPSLRASLRNVPAEDVATTLGREACLSLGTDGIFDDTFTDVPAKFALWCNRAVDASIEAADLPTSIVASGAFQLAYSTDDAASQLVRDLKELAATLLFAQPSTEPPSPESCDLLVPARIIRRALAAVGNPSPNGHSNLLLATGRTFTRHLADAGHFVTGHRWIYPSAPFRHPFSTHRNLDGTVIQMDSATMTPGDGSEHCLCVAAPILE